MEGNTEIQSEVNDEINILCKCVPVIAYKVIAKIQLKCFYMEFCGLIKHAFTAYHRSCTKITNERWMEILKSYNC